MRCPCGGRIKKGVDYRIYELSKWEKPHHPIHRPPYVHILPLAEIISITHSKGVTTAICPENMERDDKNFKNEITALIHAPIEEVQNWILRLQMS